MTGTTGAAFETTVEIAAGTGWVTICPYDRLTPGRGVAALIEGEQVAVFRTRAGELYALGNRDPFSGAYVMSRGIVGRRGGVPIVTSPMYQQAFDLRTGECLDEPTTPDGTPAALPTWRVRARS
ncbi:nitrite reductase small subunit NirD [Embleya sp. MST-111070]|uniref:nitrite reductase small subunit NirD n=1 Tax=Embleya sp. MST-111070 TaxID=3398231 RepID=UPI003F738CBB